MGQAQYDVFISYSRKDYLDENGNVRPNNIVSKIKSLLEDNSISYWFDEDGIYSGDSFGEKIAKMIKQSSVFVFISTKNSNASSWTSDEIATARSYNKKIIPFRYDSSNYNDSVILFIAKLDYIDYSKGEKKAFCSLLSSIRNHKASLDQEEKRVKEKEARDEKARQQAIIISEIKDETTELSEKEKELEAKRRGIKQRIDTIDSIEAKSKLNESLAETNSEAYQLRKKFNALLEDNKKLEEGLKSTKQSNSKKIFIPAVIILSILSILFMILYFDREEDYQKLISDYAEKHENYSQLCDSHPILITKLSVTNSANQKNEMDGTETDYVYPKISYKSFVSGGIELLVKIYNPNGQLSENKSISPKGYSYNAALNIYEKTGGDGEDIGAWGYKDKGLWDKGKYRIEIWYNDCCLKAGDFYIQ